MPPWTLSRTPARVAISSPPPELGAGTLSVVSPLGLTLATARRAVGALGLTADEPFPGTPAVHGEAAALTAALTALGESLTELELDGTQALLVGAGVAPGWRRSYGRGRCGGWWRRRRARGSSICWPRAGALPTSSRSPAVPSRSGSVETAAECARLRAHGAVYRQGYLFARQAAPPPPGTAPVDALAAVGESGLHSGWPCGRTGEFTSPAL